MGLLVRSMVSYFVHPDEGNELVGIFSHTDG